MLMWSKHGEADRSGARLSGKSNVSNMSSCRSALNVKKSHTLCRGFMLWCRSATPAVAAR